MAEKIGPVNPNFCSVSHIAPMDPVECLPRIQRQEERRHPTGPSILHNIENSSCSIRGLSTGGKARLVRFDKGGKYWEQPVC